MHTFGDDFLWTNAKMWFDNLDQIVKYINSHPEDFNATVLYSTPTIYLGCINAQKNIIWPVKFDDFFPYSDNEHGFWAGYFTSRVALKG